MAKLGKVKYVRNHESMGRFLKSNRVGDVAMKAAKDIADDAAQAERLRRKKGPATGRLAAGYRTQRAMGGAKAEGGLRAIGLVRNDVPYAAVIELGDKGVGGAHVLERAGNPYHVPKGARRAMGRGK